MPAYTVSKRASKSQTSLDSDFKENALRRHDLFTYAAYREMLAGWAQQWVEKKRTAALARPRTGIKPSPSG
jgi:hypothetical protein